MSRIDPHAGRAPGVSLVELMVALVLGLIVTGSALTLVLTHRRTFAATEDMGQVQEGVRLAFELLSRELRGAAGNPCDSSKSVYSGLNNPEASWWSDWADFDSAGVRTTTAPALRGYGGATPFADAAFGTAVGARVAGTDAIEIKAAVPISADVAILTTDYARGSADPIGVNSMNGIETGDLLLICNFVSASIFRVTGSAGGIQHGTGAEPFENTESWIPQDASVTVDFDSGAIVSKVHAARWYIGNNGEDVDGDGAADGRSLYRAMLTNTAGVLGATTDEIARGITDMQVTYLIRGAVDYVDASAVASFGDGNPVVGVRVQLTLSGDDRIGPNGERIQRIMTHTVAVRGTAQ